MVETSVTRFEGDYITHKNLTKKVTVGFKRHPEDSQRSVKVITFLKQGKKAQRKEGVEKQKE